MTTKAGFSRLLPAGRYVRNTTTWKKLRHKLSLMTSPRQNSHFTGFLRLPTQFDALSGPVIDFILSRRRDTHPLQITDIGCSNGAEAYTIASVLVNRRPDLAFEIRAYDIEPGHVRQATSGCYEAGEVLNNKVLTDAFVRTTFDRVGDGYRVKRTIAGHVAFEIGDVLDERLVSRALDSDIVFAQNVLFHLTPRLAKRALTNIFLMTHPGAAIFLDGTDLSLRQRFARSRHLTPLACCLQRIHDEARRARAAGWPYSYWGLEPFMASGRDWARRYATIFLVR
jgi:chemotaxis protein methyltransferase CheR